MEKARMVVLLVGIAFFWIANICHDNTVRNLKDEIKELKSLIKE